MPKLTQDIVVAIRLSTEPIGVCAARFGLSRTTVQNVRNGKVWPMRPMNPASEAVRSPRLAVARGVRSHRWNESDARCDRCGCGSDVDVWPLATMPCPGGGRWVT